MKEIEKTCAKKINDLIDVKFDESQQEEQEQSAEPTSLFLAWMKVFYCMCTNQSSLHHVMN